MDGSSSSSDSMACFDTICSDAAAHTSSATEGTTNCGCGWGSSGSSSRGGAALLPGLAASVYVLSEGPLAAALMAWQCAWVLDSADHTVRWVSVGFVMVSCSCKLTIQGLGGGL